MFLNARTGETDRHRHAPGQRETHTRNANIPWNIHMLSQVHSSHQSVIERCSSYDLLGVACVMSPNTIIVGYVHSHILTKTLVSHPETPCTGYRAVGCRFIAVSPIIARLDS